MEGSTGGRGVRVEAGVGKGMQVVVAAAGSELHLIAASNEGYQNFFNKDIKRLCNRQTMNLLIFHYWMTKIYILLKGKQILLRNYTFLSSRDATPSKLQYYSTVHVEMLRIHYFLFST